MTAIEIVHGKVIRITDSVRRITAPNAGIMTGLGTNTYLVGNNQVAVIDPGPADQSHIDAILNCCGDNVRWILATHTHRDHSPAAIALAQATGAQLLGNVMTHNDGFQDESFIPTKGFFHDECFDSDEFCIRALHTPGHVDNHLCYLIENDGLLLTGDHIMQGSTVVIIPPYGDMKKYIDSLRLLLNYPISVLGPAHGYLIDQPKNEISRLINHRLARESKVIDALTLLAKSTLNQLVTVVYQDVNSSLHALAKHSLLAHLLKLEQELRVYQEGDKWVLAN